MTKRILRDLEAEKTPQSANLGESPRVMLAEYIQEMLNNRRKSLGNMTLTGLANYLGVNPGVIWRARNLDDPFVAVQPALMYALAEKGHIHPEDVRRALTVEVEPCAKCGDVHTLAHCNAGDRNKLKEGERVFAAKVDAWLFNELTSIRDARGWTNAQLLEKIVSVMHSF